MDAPPPSEREPFLAWPGLPHLAFACRGGLAVAAWFAVVFAGADRFTAWRLLRVQVSLPGELAIPLWPAWAWAYHSINLLFLPAALVLRTRRQFSALAWAMAAAILAAGAGFLLVPAQLAFPAPPPESLTPMLKAADDLNMTYNLLPSLHVTLALLCAAAYADKAGKLGKTLLGLWAFAIALSTLFTHQHHVADVAAGAALAWACRRWVHLPLAAGRALSWPETTARTPASG